MLDIYCTSKFNWVANVTLKAWKTVEWFMSTIGQYQFKGENLPLLWNQTIITRNQLLKLHKRGFQSINRVYSTVHANIDWKHYYCNYEDLKSICKRFDAYIDDCCFERALDIHVWRCTIWRSRLLEMSLTHYDNPWIQNINLTVNKLLRSVTGRVNSLRFSYHVLDSSPQF